MLLQESLLVTLVKLVDGIPIPALPTRGCGYPPVYPDRLLLQPLVIMMVLCWPMVKAFLTVLAEPTTEMPDVDIDCLCAFDPCDACLPLRCGLETGLLTMPDETPSQHASCPHQSR